MLAPTRVYVHSILFTHTIAHNQTEVQDIQYTLHTDTGTSICIYLFIHTHTFTNKSTGLTVSMQYDVMIQLTDLLCTVYGLEC